MNLFEKVNNEIKQNNLNTIFEMRKVKGDGKKIGRSLVNLTKKQVQESCTERFLIDMGVLVK